MEHTFGCLKKNRFESQDAFGVVELLDSKLGVFGLYAKFLSKEEAWLERRGEKIAGARIVPLALFMTALNEGGGTALLPIRGWF
jgi:hypothetical protein